MSQNDQWCNKLFEPGKSGVRIRAANNILSKFNMANFFKNNDARQLSVVLANGLYEAVLLELKEVQKDDLVTDMRFLAMILKIIAIAGIHPTSAYVTDIYSKILEKLYFMTTLDVYTLHNDVYDTPTSSVSEKMTIIQRINQVCHMYLKHSRM